MTNIKRNFWAELWDTDGLISLQELLDQDYNWGEKLVFELGSGAGLDTLYLSRSGWKVIAIDKSPEAGRQLSNLLGDELMNRIEFRQQYFHEVNFCSCNLIHAKFSLPFCHSRYEFNKVWDRILSALEPGGIFCGQLFGIDDEWNGKHSLVFHSKAEVDVLTTGFEVIQILEIKKNAPTLNSGHKLWHIFHLILKKR